MTASFRSCCIHVLTLHTTIPDATSVTLTQYQTKHMINSEIWPEISHDSDIQFSHLSTTALAVS